MPGQFHWGLVGLSIAIAICASYTALDLAGRTTTSRGPARFFWLFGGAFAMGQGIWAMHYIGMLAFTLPVPIFYNIPLVVLSLSVAVVSSAVALLLVSRPKLSNLSLAAGSLAIGGGIAAMHYIGILAMRLAARPVYNFRLFALSIFTAILASDVALRLAFRLRNPRRGRFWLRSAAAIIMGGAISAMHYIGMAAASFQPAPLVAAPANSIGVSSLGIAGIVVVSLTVLALSIVGSEADRRFSLQRALLDSGQERWRLLLEANQDGLFDYNLRTGEVYVSPRWEALLGFGPGEFQPSRDTLIERIHPEDIERVKTHFRNYLLAGHGALDMENRVLHRDGRYRWLQSRSQAVWDQDGLPLRLVGSVSDITARKQHEENLRLSENRYRELFEQTPLPSMIYCTSDLRILDANQAFIDHYGWSREELLAMTVEDIRAPGNQAALDAELAECSKNHRPTKPRRHRRKNRSDIWVEVSSYDTEAFGCPARLNMAKDVTGHIEAGRQIQRENQQMEALIVERTSELQKSEAIWHGLVEALPQFVWTMTPEGRCDYMSSQWAEYSGVPASQLVGDGWFDTIHPLDRARIESCQQAICAAEESFEFEYRIRAQDGSYRWFVARGRPVRASAGGPIVQWLGTSTDIDDQKRSEEGLEAAVRERTLALAEARDRAECAAQAKTDFLALISHEIRTPMNGVIGMAHLLADTPLSAEQHHYLAAIRSSGDALLTIINDVLDFSKIDAGKLKLENVEFDLKTVLDESLELIALPAAAKKIELSLEVAADVPFNVVGDAGRLRQILLNLLGNAVKFTERGSVSVFVSRQPAADNAVLLRISVRDTGIGLSPEEQGKLFQAFTQADSSTTRRFGGTGLGLSIARRLAELMGGTIGVASQVGEGSIFWFDVYLMAGTGPARAPDSTHSSAAASKLHEEAGFQNRFAGCPHRILLADDSITNQQVALAMLTKMGLRADAVADGAEALKALDAIPYSLVLMDVRMPNMDGLEAAGRIRGAEGRALNSASLPPGHRLPIIAMTASAMYGDREKCLEAGMDDYISKPVNFRMLAEVLDKWLPEKAAEGVAAAQHPSPDYSRRGLPLAPSSVFDMDGLLGRLMNDRDLAAAVLDTFLNDMPRQLVSLGKSVEAGSAQDVENQAHRIKGASANVGGIAMQKVAFDLEMAGRSGKLGGVKERMADLQAQFARLKEAIAQHLVAGARSLL